MERMFDGQINWGQLVRRKRTSSSSSSSPSNSAEKTIKKDQKLKSEWFYYLAAFCSNYTDKLNRMNISCLSTAGPKKARSRPVVAEKLSLWRWRRHNRQREKRREKRSRAITIETEKGYLSISFFDSCRFPSSFLGNFYWHFICKRNCAIWIYVNVEICLRSAKFCWSAHCVLAWYRKRSLFSLYCDH